jgi:hypothetical protein
MDPIRINYHSFVDLITNSSTEIYISCHTKSVEYLKELIDSLLKASGSDKKAEELFDFKITKEDYNTGKVKTLKKDEDFELDDDNEYGKNHTLLIIPKDKTQETINLCKQIKNIFEIDGVYNG